MLIYSGEVEVNLTQTGTVNFSSNQVIYSEPYHRENQNQLKIKALKDTIVFSVSKDILDTLIFDYTELRGIVLELIDNML